ncbi:hypothetical protein [Isoptericola sp. NPDC055881]
MSTPKETVAEALADDWNPSRDPILTAMFRDYADTATHALRQHRDDIARALHDRDVDTFAHFHEDTPGECAREGHWMQWRDDADVVLDLFDPKGDDRG